MGEITKPWKERACLCEKIIHAQRAHLKINVISYLKKLLHSKLEPKKFVLLENSPSPERKVCVLICMRVQKIYRRSTTLDKTLQVRRYSCTSFIVKSNLINVSCLSGIQLTIHGSRKPHAF